MIIKGHHRRSHGNILILTCVLMTLVALGLVIGMSFSSVFLMRARLQSEANDIALAAAQVLNDNDREGRMNNMISRSRQLVTASRSNYSVTRGAYPDLEPLAKQLLDEARDSARFLEAERVRLRDVAISEAKQRAQETCQNLKDQTRLMLPWLHTDSTTMVNISLGYIDGVQSNVAPARALPDLEQHDQNAGYIRQQSNLYLGNIRAKLPSEDGDLAFSLSSLPAPVDGSVSPARATLASAYRDSPTDQLPSAVRIELALPVSTELGAKTQAEIKTLGCAATYGAAPPT